MIRKSEFVTKTQYLCAACHPKKGFIDAQKNLVLATNSHFLITISIYPNVTRRPLIFQTINSVRSNNLCLKYPRFTPSGYRDKGIRLRVLHSLNKILTY